jgi:hypothetical protein
MPYVAGNRMTIELSLRRTLVRSAPYGAFERQIKKRKVFIISLCALFVQPSSIYQPIRVSSQFNNDSIAISNLMLLRS